MGQQIYIWDYIGKKNRRMEEITQWPCCGGAGCREPTGATGKFERGVGEEDSRVVHCTSPTVGGEACRSLEFDRIAHSKMVVAVVEFGGKDDDEDDDDDDDDDDGDGDGDGDGGAAAAADDDDDDKDDFNLG